MRKFFLLVLLTISLVGCKSVKYISPALPDYSPIKPERPTLQAVPGDAYIPIEININTALLIGYINQLESYADGWEDFYCELIQSTNAE